MKQGILQSSRYSPGNMNRDSLEALFVGRQGLMEDVLHRIETSIRTRQKHFMLLVGPRGSGKTHFLALAYHCLMDRLREAGVDQDVTVAILNEEEWGVASYLDLVVRILRSLGQDDPTLGARIDDVYARFSWNPAEAEAYAVELLRECARGKTLLLLCENLVDLFAGLDEEGQKRWRATIQEDGNWAIVATTPSLFDGLTLQDGPFYGFFTIRHLEAIDFEEGIELLAKKAVHEAKGQLANFLRTPLGRARARAIHHLAAGNHRAYVVLFDFLDKESLEDLIGPFMHLVDDLTPYYQDRMRLLPPTQRKIIEFLCLRGKPTTVKDIAAPCLMSQQTAAKQIGELEVAGFVKRMRAGRHTFCELSEPLMRICIEVKDNKTRHFRLLVDFLRHWFSTRELGRTTDGILALDALLSTEDCHSLLIAASSARDAGLQGPATRYLDRIAELEPESRTLWIERTLLMIDAGDFDAASRCAARVQALPGGALMGRLLAARAAAATQPLHAALERIGPVVQVDEFVQEELLHLQATAQVLVASVEHFGPRYLPEALAKLQAMFADLLDAGVIGNLLTDFLIECADQGFPGSLEEWETALAGVGSCVVDRDDCIIPLEMLRSAVTCWKTGDYKSLLSLPVEERELLEDMLPSAFAREARRPAS